MSILEDKIRKNRSLFDQSEPNEGHMERFSGKLDQLHRGRNSHGFSLGILKRVAAIFVAMITVSLLVIMFTRPPSTAVASNQLPEELREAQLYYSNLADEKMDKIAACAVNEEEAKKLRSIAAHELDEINAQTIELEKEYFMSAENEKIESALIANYKSKSEILDNILDRLCKL